MQGMSGYEVIRIPKSDPATRHIPGIFLTAMSAAEDEQRGLDPGGGGLYHQADISTHHAGALRRAHTPKGNASTIGAVAVQAKADRLEQACQQQSRSQVEDALLATVVALEEVLIGLRHLTQESDPVVVSPPASIAQHLTASVRGAMEQLHQQLQGADPQATDAKHTFAADQWDAAKDTGPRRYNAALCGCSSVDRVLASEAKGRGFDPRQPHQHSG